MKRTFLSALVAGALLPFALVGPATPAASSGEAHLVPDLRPLRPSGLTIGTDDFGDEILRFNVDILNKGKGPLELHPREEDCDADGDPDNDRGAYQKLFVDNGNDSFDRDVDASEERFAGCQHFHVEHQHWHFDNFGTYKLWKFKRGELIRKSVSVANKISFCMVDTYAYLPDLAGAPATRYYHAADGSDCGQENVTGISIGWVDRYGYQLPGQSLSVEGLKNGRYCLRVRSDPKNLLVESNDSNNARGIKFRMRGTELSYPKNPRCR